MAELAASFGTPAYVYSRSAIEENFNHIEGRLADIPHLICYSVKANSNLRILNLLRQAGAGFDIVSRGELARALKVGARPDTIVFSGVGKDETEIDAALAAGILMFNVESAGELEAIARRARHLKKQGNISIRVNPDVEADTHPYISTGQFIHKFGVPKDQAIDLFRRAATMPELQVRGVTCHIGSQILEIDPFVKALEEILELARTLERDGIRLEFLDLGGGYGIRYVDENPLEMDRLTAELKGRLAETPYRLIMEPGRALVGNAGALLDARSLHQEHREKTLCGGRRRHERSDAPHTLRLIAPDCARRTPHRKNLYGGRGGAALRDRRLPGARPRIALRGTRRPGGRDDRGRLRLRPLVQLQFPAPPARGDGLRQPGGIDSSSGKTGRFDGRGSALTGCWKKQPSC